MSGSDLERFVEGQVAHSSLEAFVEAQVGMLAAELPQPPAAATERLRNLWKELINRAATDADDRLSIEAAAVEADWNPAAHPRGPDGKFVERPYDIPDSIRGMDTVDIVRELNDEDPDFTDKVKDVGIDGVVKPDESVPEALDRIEEEQSDGGGTVDQTGDSQDESADVISSRLNDEMPFRVEISNMDPDEAKQIEEGLQDMNSKYDLSELGAVEVGERDDNSSAIAWFDRRPDSDEGDAVVIRDGADSETIQKWNETGSHVSSNFRGIVTHELGHHLTERTDDPWGIWREESGGSVIDDGTERFQKIEDSISGYADSAWPELIAETFAAVNSEGMDVDEIPDDVLELYYEVGGPELRGGA